MVLCLQVQIYLFKFKDIFFNILTACKGKTLPFGIYFGIYYISPGLEFCIQDIYYIFDFSIVFNEILSTGTTGNRDTVYSLELLSLPSFELYLVCFGKFIISISLSLRLIYSWSRSWVNWSI